MDLTKKYTGIDVDMTRLHTVQPRLAAALAQAVTELQGTEQRLIEGAARLAEVAAKITAELQQPTARATSRLNTLGELQNDQTDTLLALRGQQIAHLQQLVRLI